MALEEYFSLGFLFFNHDALIARNGTPLVDIALRLNVTNPADIDPITSTFHLALNNTAGSDNPEEMIEPVTILNPLEPLDFHDSQGKPCFFELTIRVIPETDDDAGEGSSYDFSQSQEGVAVLFGRLTTRPEDPGAANRKSADDAGTPNRNSTDPRRQRATSILR